MRISDRLHAAWISGRRRQVLARRVADLLPHAARVLDVGCGDGRLACEIAQRRPDLQFTGLELFVRPQTAIPVRPYDGQTLPEAAASWDAVLLVDVLHHTPDPARLLGEAARVARGCVVIKDHLREGWLAGPTLRFMDRVGNARFGVPLPYNYWTYAQWIAGFQAAGLTAESWSEQLGLYPGPADWVFGRRLHFLARLSPAAAPGSTRPAHFAFSASSI